MKSSGKPVAALVIGVGKGKPDSTPDDEDMHDDDTDDAYSGSEGAEAIETYEGAVAQKDWEAAYEAFEKAVKLCTQSKAPTKEAI